MANALNLTAPLKQDAESQQRLMRLAATFADQVQPKIDAVLSKSRIVHFARILVIDNKYLQVITEFDGTPAGRHLSCRRGRNDDDDAGTLRAWIAWNSAVPGAIDSFDPITDGLVREDDRRDTTFSLRGDAVL